MTGNGAVVGGSSSDASESPESVRAFFAGEGPQCCSAWAAEDIGAGGGSVSAEHGRGA